MSVLASVIVPVLDEERHLPAVAEQMLAQEVDGELEFLFVDGGSADGTVAIVDDLAARDPRVRLLHNPAAVTPASLNIGLRAARGRYVVFGGGLPCWSGGPAPRAVLAGIGVSGGTAAQDVACAQAGLDVWLTENGDRQ